MTNGASGGARPPREAIIWARRPCAPVLSGISRQPPRGRWTSLPSHPGRNRLGWPAISLVAYIITELHGRARSTPGGSRAPRGRGRWPAGSRTRRRRGQPDAGEDLGEEFG